MIDHLKALTGYPLVCVLDRFRRLTTIAIASMVIMLMSSLVAGGMLYMELTTTYAENYAALAAAGIQDVVTSPHVVQDRLLLLISFFPLVGAGLVLPLFLMATREINSLKVSYQFVDKNVAGDVGVAQGSVDQGGPESGAVIDQSILLTNHCQILVEHTEGGPELVLVRVPTQAQV